MANAELERQGLNKRIDHRSYERQSIEQIPSIHMGVAACQMERKGIVTERGEENRSIADINKELRQMRARLNKLNKWLSEIPQTNTPNIQDVISEILNPNSEKTH
jgi:hypothetical protein